jgi:methylenetetrahydrofolate dehydrogenase (NADP+)/methenyltetrahydrofolate cyclohydrolase
MSGTVLDGKRIRDEILKELRPRIDALTAKKRAPALAVVLAGDNPASKIYVGNKIKACEEIGIRSVKITAPEDVTTDELYRKLEPLTKDQSIDAVLVQMPLPKQINAEEIVSYAFRSTSAEPALGAGLYSRWHYGNAQAV